MSIAVWEQVFSSQEWGKYPAEPLIRFVAKNFYAMDRSSVRILEIGCGPGANLWYLAREGFSFAGVEGSSSAIQQAADRLDSEFSDWRARGELIHADITSYDFGVEAFDAVIDNECVYCLPFLPACDVYSRARAALKPGGKLFVRTFAKETWGFHSGIKLDESTFVCEEGPLAGKGSSRFTAEEDIPVLLQGYHNISVEKTSYTLQNGGKVVAEWLIEAVK